MYLLRKTKKKMKEIALNISSYRTNKRLVNHIMNIRITILLNTFFCES